MNDSAQTLVIERLIPAPPRQVFEAWLDPEALRRFMCAGKIVQCTTAECDARVGGKFLIVMNAGGKEIPHRGEYLEIERHTLLCFTWLSPHAGEGSRVTLRFAEGPGGTTKLTLEHLGLANAERRAQHRDGWTNILTGLAAFGEGVS